jgi:hypothetical protein
MMKRNGKKKMLGMLVHLFVNHLPGSTTVNHNMSTDRLDLQSLGDRLEGFVELH